jgi:sigma-B regulation protein RsbU (phosphoserine phosphatase)
MADGDLEQELQDLTEELVDVQDQLLAFFDLADAMRGHVEPGSLLSALVAEAVRLVRARAGFATLEQAGRPPVAVSPDSSVSDASALRISEKLGSESQLADHDVPGLGSVLLVSIPVEGKTRAALGLVRPRGETFGAPARRLAAALAAHAGSQLENVLLYQDRLSQARIELEFSLARGVQAGLTPALPDGYPDLDLFAESRPASEVGGDFYDFAVRERQRLVCTLGDVAGKGVSAALLVAMTRSTIRVAARVHPWASPAAVLKRANSDLYSDFSRLGFFATVFLTRFDSAASRLTVANAGHSPVIYRPAGGPARLLDADGLPLGILPEWEGGDSELRLGPGDLLIAATDGFNEAMDDARSELFGLDRLLALADELADRDAAQMASGLFQATDSFAGTDGAADDRTLLILRGVQPRQQAQAVRASSTVS